MNKSKTLALMALLILALGAGSCKKENPVITPANHSGGEQKYMSVMTGTTPQSCGTPSVVALIAGQHINVGTVTVSNDANNLTVTYATTGGWNLQELHLYVGDRSLVPVNRQGAPVPGQFPKSAYLGNNVQRYTFTIPLSGLGSCFIVLAEAKVSCRYSTETAWAAGTRFTNNINCGWATYFSYCKQTCTTTCIQPPNILLTGEVPWPNGGAPITVGGYTYTQTSMMPIAISTPSSDAKNALMLIATLKIYGNSIAPPSSVLSDAVTAENWLSTLGQLTITSRLTAPTNVETAIDNLFAWESSQMCQ